jgi:hypothetical protein
MALSAILILMLPAMAQAQWQIHNGNAAGKLTAVTNNVVSVAYASNTGGQYSTKVCSSPNCDYFVGNVFKQCPDTQSNYTIDGPWDQAYCYDGSWVYTWTDVVTQSAPCSIGVGNTTMDTTDYTFYISNGVQTDYLNNWNIWIPYGLYVISTATTGTNYHHLFANAWDYTGGVPTANDCASALEVVKGTIPGINGRSVTVRLCEYEPNSSNGYAYFTPAHCPTVCASGKSTPENSKYATCLK